MGTLTVITEPAAEPVSLPEAKEALAVEHDDDDARINGLIKSARIFAERFCNLNIMTKTVERSYDSWPGSNIYLDVWPLQSIDSVIYNDTGSPVTEQTLVEGTDYYTDIVTIGGRVIAILGWPSVAAQPKPIRIRMTAGYLSAEVVPENIKDGIKSYVVYLYEAVPAMESIARNILWSERRL